MAITKTPKNAWRAASATPIKEPWEIEHERSLATHGPTASTNHIYPSTVHRGFDADFTAEEFTRRYPIFEEMESHRDFLVRSRSARSLRPEEKDDYFTPEQLWEEDDRLRGVNQFARSGEASWVDELDDETEDDEDEGQAVEQRVVVQEEPDDEQDEDIDLPFSFHADDHATTVTVDYRQVEAILNSLELLTTATPKTITSSFVDGRLAIALCGRENSDNTLSNQPNENLQRAAQVDDNSSSRPAELDSNATARTQKTPYEATEEDETTTDDWNVMLKDSIHPTVGLLSGAKTLSALMATVDLGVGTTVAIIQKYSDGKVVVIIVGRQRAKEAPRDEIEYASYWAEFLRTVQKATRHGAFPAQHIELASLLRTAGDDLVKAGLLDDFVLPAEEEEGMGGLSGKASVSDVALKIASGQGDLSDEDIISALRQQIKETQQALDVARKDTQPNLSCSPSRMLKLLERPSVDYEALERAEKHMNAFMSINTASTYPTIANSAGPLQNPMLARNRSKKTRPTRPSNNISSPATARSNLNPSHLSKKRSRETSAEPSDSSPDPQKTKKRKIAAARAKGRGKA